jgi:hypothetical protein
MAKRKASDLCGNWPFRAVCYMLVALAPLCFSVLIYTKLLGQEMPDLNQFTRHYQALVRLDTTIDRMRTNIVRKIAPQEPVLKIQSCRYCRLGNHLFRFLSLMGIAHDNNMVPCTDQQGRQALKRIFVGPFDASCEVTRSKATQRMYKASAFESLVLPATQSGRAPTTKLVGAAYLQSWRYFSNLAPETAFAALAFKDTIQKQADIAIRRCCTAKTSIAIHVRRTDLMNHSFVTMIYSNVRS